MMKFILILFLGFIIGPLLIVGGFNMWVNSKTLFKEILGIIMCIVGFVLAFIALAVDKFVKVVITF